LYAPPVRGGAGAIICIYILGAAPPAPTRVVLLGAGFIWELHFLRAIYKNNMRPPSLKVRLRVTSRGGGHRKLGPQFKNKKHAPGCPLLPPPRLFGGGSHGIALPPR
jgi:hypothetical protein